MTNDFIGPDLERWLQHLESLEAQDPTTPSRTAYLNLLMELGYTEEMVQNVEETANQLVLTAHGYLDSGAHEQAIHLLSKAYGLMPWRVDLVPTLADANTTSFGKTLSKAQGDAARKYTDQWIRLEPQNPSAFQTLQTLNAFAKKRTRRLMLQCLGGVALCLFFGYMYGVETQTMPPQAEQPEEVQTPKAPLAHSLDSPKASLQGFTLPAGNLTVRQPIAKDSAGQTTPGEYGLPVTASNRTPIPGLRIDASESSLIVKAHIERRHGRLKLRLHLDEDSPNSTSTASIVELKALVEWLTRNHEVVDAKQITLVHRDTKLYAGESQSAHQSNFDLPPSALYARLTVTHLITGVSSTRKPSKKACIATPPGLPSELALDVHVHSVAKSAVVHKSLFSVKNRGDDIDTLYAFPMFYDENGELIQRASKRNLLTRKSVVSAFTPILASGEERFIRLANILNPDDRRAIRKVCLEFTQDGQIP